MYYMTVLISLSRIDFPKVQMGKHNRTVLTEFILMGITDGPELGSTVWALPHHLCDLSGGQLGHGHPHQEELQATDTHVLLSQIPGSY